MHNEETALAKRISALETQTRRYRWLLAVSLCVPLLLGFMLVQQGQPGTAQEIVARKLTIRDSQGHDRILLYVDESLPGGDARVAATAMAPDFGANLTVTMHATQFGGGFLAETGGPVMVNLQVSGGANNVPQGAGLALTGAQGGSVQVTSDIVRRNLHPVPGGCTSLWSTWSPPNVSVTGPGFVSNSGQTTSLQFHAINWQSATCPKL
jgi:hypothetical protein